MKTLNDRLDEMSDILVSNPNDLDLLEDILEELKLLSSTDQDTDNRICNLLMGYENAITDLVLGTDLINL